jgi:hypothetical protein
MRAESSEPVDSPITQGRGQRSVLDKAEAVHSVVVASLPAPVDMVHGAGLGGAPVSMSSVLSAEPIRNVSLPPDCSSVLLICGCINSCCYYTTR